MVSLIKELCASKKTTIKALERELGLGNGTIRRWDDSSPAYEKLQKVADYFGITVAELTGETLTNENKPATPEGSELTDMQQKAFDMIKQMTDEQLKAFIAAAEAFLR